MRRISPIVFAALLPLFAVGSAPDAEPAGFLIRAEISDDDPAVEFVSLLPSDRGDFVWSDPRLPAWRRRVAAKLGLEPRNVAVRPFDGTLRAEIVERDLAGLVSVGDVGVQEVPIVSDAGRKTVVRNEFEVKAVRDGVLTLRWKAPDGRPFVLRCGQGAGRDIRFLSAADLDERWKNAGGSGVRTEFWGVRSSDRVKNDPSWRSWLDAIQRDSPALWPSLVFRNRKETDIVVTCCGEKSGPIAPGDSWTFRPKKDPGRIVWSFRAGDLRDEDFGNFRETAWRPDGTEPEIEINVVQSPKPDPYLVFGADAIPYPAVWGALAPSGEEGRDTDLSLTVSYADGTVDAFSGRSDAEKPLRPYDSGGAGTDWIWRADLRPRKRIKSIRLSSASYLAESDLLADEPEYGCGESARLRKGSAARLLPWPKLTVRNQSDFPADFTVYRMDGTSVANGESVGVANAVPNGRSAEIELVGLSDSPETNATLRVAISARKATERSRDVSICRGKALPDVFEMKTEFTPLGWVGKTGRQYLVEDDWTLLGRDDTDAGYRKVLTPTGEIDPGKFLDACKKGIMSQAEFTTLRVHFGDCPLDNCPDCKSLKPRFLHWRRLLPDGSNRQFWSNAGVDMSEERKTREKETIDAEVEDFRNAIATLLVLFEEYQDENAANQLKTECLGIK